jgi:hypothetical protein
MGRKLFFPAAIQKFYYLEKTNHFGELFDGNGGICVDKYPGKFENF